MSRIISVVAVALASCSSGDKHAPSHPTGASGLSNHERATNYLLGQGVGESVEEAIDLYRAGCAKGELESCRVVFAIANERITPEDRLQAYAELAKRCLEGEPTSCHTIRRGERPYPAGKQLEEARRMCDQGLAIACTDAARYVDQTLDSDDPEPPDPEQLQLFEKGCELGEPWGCTAVSLLVWKALGRESEKARWEKAAEAALQALCSAGDVHACLELAADGQGEEYRERANTLALDACGKGAVELCLQIRFDSLTAEELRAAEIGCRLRPAGCTRACGPGHADACRTE